MNTFYIDGFVHARPTTSTYGGQGKEKMELLVEHTTRSGGQYEKKHVIKMSTNKAELMSKMGQLNPGDFVMCRGELSLYTKPDADTAMTFLEITGFLDRIPSKNPQPDPFGAEDSPF